MPDLFWLPKAEIERISRYFPHSHGTLRDSSRCRRGEIENLRCAEVDLPSQTPWLEDSKKGASVRPIGKAVVDLLEGLTRSGPYVYPRREKPMSGWPGRGADWSRKPS